MRFEWDSRKEALNRQKHGVGFDEAKELFEPGNEGRVLEIFDESHSSDEERFISIGPIRRGLVVVVWTERVEDTVRIISARGATAKEKALYLEHVEANDE